MESAEQTTMGITKTRNRKRPSETDIIYGRPLSMGSNQNLCCQSNLKRKAVASRTCQLLRLLYGTTCFEVMLNRRMPNGMYGGVRGERKSPLLDFLPFLLQTPLRPHRRNSPKHFLRNLHKIFCIRRQEPILVMGQDEPMLDDAAL